jgi:hypothetical protein
MSDIAVFQQPFVLRGQPHRETRETGETVKSLTIATRKPKIEMELLSLLKFLQISQVP